MKRISIAALALLCAFSAFGQTNNLAAAGVTYNPGGSPSVAGTALYARSVSAVGTYAFTVIDAMPTSVKPFTVDTAVGAGVAQKVFSIGTVSIYVPTAAGISWVGTHTGWSWSTGALACIPIGKSSWRIMPQGRVLKSSVAPNGGPTGSYGVMGGVLIGWGW